MPLLETFTYELTPNAEILAIRPHASRSLANVIVLDSSQSHTLKGELFAAAVTTDSVDQYCARKQELLNHYYRQHCTEPYSV